MVTVRRRNVCPVHTDLGWRPALRNATDGANAVACACIMHTHTNDSARCALFIEALNLEKRKIVPLSA